MTQPEWLNAEIYPFESRTLALDAGNMHYIDEGQGECILMVHGTPTWSFLYRHFVAHLRTTHRVVVPDHMGFGLSDKPADYSYKPQAQSQMLTAFIEQLGLQNITLVVHDFGGPIGLSYALANPHNVKRLVLFNTWMWSLRRDWTKIIGAGILGSPLGRLLYDRFDFEFKAILPMAYGDRAKFTPEIEAHYRRPFDHPLMTQIAWIQARELLRSGKWYESLWAQRDALKHIPALLIWGMQDPVFGAAYLKRWQDVFTDAETVQLANVGHFVPDEAPDEALPHLRTFLGA